MKVVPFGVNDQQEVGFLIREEDDNFLREGKIPSHTLIFEHEDVFSVQDILGSSLQNFLDVRKGSNRGADCFPLMCFDELIHLFPQGCFLYRSQQLSLG